MAKKHKPEEIVTKLRQVDVLLPDSRFRYPAKPAFRCLQKGSKALTPGIELSVIVV
jgi:hypothetical protein